MEGSRAPAVPNILFLGQGQGHVTLKLVDRNLSKLHLSPLSQIGTSEQSDASVSER